METNTKVYGKTNDVAVNLDDARRAIERAGSMIHFAKISQADQEAVRLTIDAAAAAVAVAQRTCFAAGFGVFRQVEIYEDIADALVESQSEKGGGE